jgi:hypothetical protein
VREAAASRGRRGWRASVCGIVTLDGRLSQLKTHIFKVFFLGSNGIRKFYFALVGVLYDERRYGVSGILCRVVRIEMDLDLSLL